MKKIHFILGVILVVFAMSGTSFASLKEFTGTWKNIDPNTGGITTLKISANRDTINVRAWGKCHPEDCDWGTVQAKGYGSNVSANLPKTAKALTAEFVTHFNRTLMAIKPLPGRMLLVEVFTHFKNDNRSAYHKEYRFKPVPPQLAVPVQPLVTEDCIGFNPATATVAKKSGRWKIIDGSHWMFDFGDNNRKARKALGIIKHYGMTKSCFVGRPNPSFQYMLVNNRAPSGAFPNEDCISFNPKKLRVQLIGGRWKIVEGTHYLFDFNNKKSEAKQSLAIIKKHRFTKSCFVGRPHPSFKYLRN